MSRTISQSTVDKIGNRFDLILIAALRAREIGKSSQGEITKPGTNIARAIEEIGQGKIGREYLDKLKDKKNKKRR